jgi:endonuclease I
LTMLKIWHTQDPVSQKEIDRNEAAYSYQGNRNPFVDYPSFVTEIWGN